MELLTLTFPAFTSLVLLLARIIIAMIMLYYGVPKILHPRRNADDFEKMGFRPGILWGTIVALLEVFGSIALLVGFGVWIAAFLFAGEMLTGAFWKIARTKKPFNDYSYDLLILTLALTLLVFGGGMYALTSLF